MTELETLQRAKMYLDKLARGIDPLTDHEILEDSVLNQVRISRCLFYVSGVLDQVIANGGFVGSKPKLREFFITPEQLLSVSPSAEPLRVTQIAERLSEAVGDSQMKKLRTTAITDWLLDRGFLEKRQAADGKNVRFPTDSGLRIGLFVESRQGQYGEYQAVYYNTQAQQFVLDHLLEMLAEG